ncbi:MAG: hypothetical protein A4E40_00219 [Methanoregulaceae archaeon PtaU1.Bin059]|nr:MAG: hypothetical protein A4E39_00661 [Methanoregulaceae archaeon PtaB.Bin152]OPY43096.1 MAG: hypothetical protein A4E40_00219 [Methanoregulaceae archaeon PtaU1.Bin059]
MAERPLGVTIIAILWIIGGLATLFGGIGFVVLFGEALGSLMEPFGFIYLILGILGIVLGIGAFSAWSWVWTAGVVITIIDLIMGVASFFSTGIISIAISAIILWYLFRPEVKAYFNKT